MKILRRYGTPPAQRCGTNVTCPDVFLLDDGSLAIVGLDATDQLDGELAAMNAARAADERIVVLPRDVMLAAVRDMRLSDQNGFPEDAAVAS